VPQNVAAGQQESFAFFTREGRTVPEGYRTMPRPQSKSAPQQPSPRTIPIGDPPLGLHMLLKMLMPDGQNNSRFVVAMACDCASVPRAILEAQQAGNDYEAVLFELTDRLFPEREEEDGEPAHASAGLTAWASFWAGVATCWYLMAAINSGKDGQR
jgi:hypothetical protein